MKIRITPKVGAAYDAYAYTGGREFDPQQPTVIMIHGVLCDHSVWILQSRYLAHHGYNVLAVDLPGHCQSAGEAPESVEAAADFIESLMDAMQLPQAALVGHSWGSLISLECASRLGQRITHLAMVGTAYPMKVSSTLLETSQQDPLQAIELINIFSRATLAPVPSALGPGTWVYGASKALGKRVLASNPKVNVFYRGFKACDSYAHGLEAMARVSCPVLFVLGQKDQMTPPKAAQSLIEQAQKSGVRYQTVLVPMGHHQMSESPEETLAALKSFLEPKSK